MAAHNELGIKGENIAQQFLKKLGYHILQTNWRYKHAEIDIIAEQQEELIFIEVKTLTSNAFGYPEAAVNNKKIEKLWEAAEEYIHQTNHTGEIRFDIISITLKPKLDIQHFKDAIQP